MLGFFVFKGINYFILKVIKFNNAKKIYNLYYVANFSNIMEFYFSTYEADIRCFSSCDSISFFKPNDKDYLRPISFSLSSK